jgi:hypothetical protein
VDGCYNDEMRMLIDVCRGVYSQDGDLDWGMDNCNGRVGRSLSRAHSRRSVAISSGKSCNYCMNIHTRCLMKLLCQATIPAIMLPAITRIVSCADGGEVSPFALVGEILFGSNGLDFGQRKQSPKLSLKSNALRSIHPVECGLKRVE